MGQSTVLPWLNFHSCSWSGGRGKVGESDEGVGRADERDGKGSTEIRKGEKKGGMEGHGGTEDERRKEHTEMRRERREKEWKERVIESQKDREGRG